MQAAKTPNKQEPITIKSEYIPTPSMKRVLDDEIEFVSERQFKRARNGFVNISDI